MSFSNMNDNANMPPLPAGFSPGEHDVVIGKGKKFYFHSGNQWLRTLVASMLGDYKQAVTKSDKSNIISEVVEYVRTNGRFVKKELKTGQWVYAEPLLCREKCSQTFRDNLAETYRSSNVAKRNKRRQEQQDKKRLGAPSSLVGHQGHGLPPLGGATEAEMPPAKRMRNMSMTGTANGASSGIPANLFDLDMPLWSPAGKNTTVLPSLPNNFDFSSLVNRRGSLTGATTSNFQQQQQPVQQQMQNNNASAFGGLNMQSFGANSGDVMASLNVNAGSNNTTTGNGGDWSNLLSSLAQTLNTNNNAPVAAAEPTFNPFEPTPLQTSAMPSLTGGHHHNSTSSNFDANAIFGALENVLNQANQQQQQNEARAPKRHSLAPLMGDDWFKFSSQTVNNNGNDDTQNISTAFAA